MMSISIHALREEGDTSRLPQTYTEYIFLSTPSARRATREKRSSAVSAKFLSTPSARRATNPKGSVYAYGTISIHALREEGDRRSRAFPRPRPISIHALREEGDQGIRGSCVNFIISIHALREEGDAFGFIKTSVPTLFLSTPSARRATLPVRVRDADYGISIHALREEGDAGDMDHGRAKGNFYPRPPRGGRLFHNGFDVLRRIFLSTPSARRAT